MGVIGFGEVVVIGLEVVLEYLVDLVGEVLCVGGKAGVGCGLDQVRLSENFVR